jgi:hypothetical protein
MRTQKEQWNKNDTRIHQNVTFELPLNLDEKELMGLRIEEGVIVPSFEPSVEVIVPFREDITDPDPLFIDSSASARSKTLPVNMELYDALCGVDGTVACTAGPSAALWGVIGSGIWGAGDCVV